MPNSIYPATGHHIGADYATPVGTSVVMPALGQVIQVGYTPILGSFCVIEYIHEGKKYQSRFLHLLKQPELGIYQQGEVFCITGNSGQSYGAHVHIDVWHNKVNLVGINAKNFRERTVDPVAHYVV